MSIVAAMPDVLRPLFDQVVIKELEPERMRKSGLLVPQGTHDLPPNEGIVLAVGDGPPDLVFLPFLSSLWWLWQYRSTRQRAALYPVDQFGGYTSELAGPATLFFVLFCVIIAAWAVVLIVGHLIWGQKF